MLSFGDNESLSRRPENTPASIALELLDPTGFIARFSRWRFPQQLGTLSYCTYVIHFAMNELVHRILLHAPPRLTNICGILATLLAAVLTLRVASLSWRFLEKPLIRRGHQHAY